MNDIFSRQIPFFNLEKRLVDWISGHMPPLESNYKNFADFWKDYQYWLGQVCTPQLFGTQFYFCANILPDQFKAFAMFFNYIPQSTTEDRKGNVGTDRGSVAIDNVSKIQGAPCSIICSDPAHSRIDDSTFAGDGSSKNCHDWAVQACATKNASPIGEPVAHTIQTDGEVDKNSIAFNPSDPNAYNDQHSLYFAHMQEDAQLAEELQNTFRSADVSGYSGKNDDGAAFYSLNNPDIKAHCEVLAENSRTSPGDSLHGDVNRDISKTQEKTGINEQQISGELSFNATFTASCKKGGIDPLTFQPMAGCSHDLLAGIAIYTRTPAAQENWERLVDGAAGIFKRFFPQVGVNAPVATIWWNRRVFFESNTESFEATRI